VNKRNDDFLRINTLIQIEGGSKFLSDERSGIYHSVSDGFDICIWLGDFNYRIDMKLNEVQQYLKGEIKQNIPHLLKYDQLKLEVEKGELFINKFIEAEIKFCPTYKLIVGSDDYVLEEGGDRIPGWTDRILYKSKNRKTLKLIEYNSIPEIVFSDHKPVYGVFEIDLTEKGDSATDEFK